MLRFFSMSGRHRIHRQPDNFRNSRDAPYPIIHRVPVPLPPHPAALEEELELQHKDIQRILTENSHVVDENVNLQRELTAVKGEIHRLGQIIPNLHAEKDTRVRELIDRGLKLEGELKDAEPLKAEVVLLRSEAQKLNSLRQELSAQVQALTKDVNRAKSENEQVVALTTDIDGMRKDLMEMRRDFEMKKKGNEEQLVQKEAMEKNLISMAREIEKLRTEQLSAERRPRGGLGAGGYGMLSGSPEMRYGGGGAYSDVYGPGAWAPYDHRGPPRR